MAKVEYTESIAVICNTFKTSRQTVYRWIDDGLPHGTGKKGTRTVYKFNVQVTRKWLSERADKLKNNFNRKYNVEVGRYE